MGQTESNREPDLKLEPEPEPSALVEAIAHGDKKAEEQLVCRYRQGIVALLESFTRDRARAEDLTHETLIVVLKKLRNESIDEPQKLASYLYQTAKFMYLGWLRKSDNQLEFREVFDSVAYTQPELESEYSSQQQCRLVRQSIEKLNVERDRDILLRYYFDEQTKPEICEALLLPYLHYDRVISRARGRLRQNINLV